MSLSLFDIVGPIMNGPSSSHTAGAARIGYFARMIAGGQPRQVTLYFHPILINAYSGHRTHTALLSGLLGHREDDPAQIRALEEAREKGLAYTIEQIDPPDVHQNTMRLKIWTDSSQTMVNGISVGGGSILITAIDGLEVELDGNKYTVLARSSQPISEAGENVLRQCGIDRTFSGKLREQYLTCWTAMKEVSRETLIKLQSLSDVASIQVIEPLYAFRDIGEKEALFTDFAQLLECSGRTSLPETALCYESERTGKPTEAILEEFSHILAVMRRAVEFGLSGELKLLGGFCSGNDGLRMMKALQAGKTLSGGVLPLAITRSLGVMEVNGAMGLVVAGPTAGSAGVLPGVVLSVGEQLAKNDDDLVRALLVAAAVGVCIANKASLSGAVGGCQAEIGVAAAISASAAAYLGGAGPEQCLHAAALALKNLLGLVCDPPAGPVEVPCIKRNSIGVAAALAGAEMAAAGIQSYIPPDEVVDALVNVQNLLPQELKGSAIGGLACTATGRRMRREWQSKLGRMS